MSSVTLVKKGSPFGATLLISGCCIGAGMIGLPVMSAAAGFLPSTIAMMLAYFFTTVTGLLLLEATLWFDRRVNLLSIAQYALGKGGKYLVGSLFLFLFYSLFVAYMDGGAQLITGILPVSREVAIVGCTALVGAVVYAGAKAIDKINRCLLIGLAVCYCALIAFGLSHVGTENLQKMDFKASVAVVPILLLCFGYQNLVPSITYYLKKNVNAIRMAIVIGNLIPFFIYFLWNYVILGILPEGQGVKGNSVGELLQSAAQSASVQVFIQGFSLFALMTSFIPNTLTFVDFLRDGLPAKFKSELLLYGLVLIPPMAFAFFNPNIFLKALGFAGGFIDVLLFGIFPAAAVWIGRYVKKAEGPYAVAGGKPLLVLIVLLSAGFLLLRNFGGL
jgi:tyrosine-specific transport protein